MTSLTTSFSIDILNIEKSYDAAKQIAIRKKIHLMFVVISILVIMLFKYGFNDVSIIDKVLKFAGFTYGPLLGLYSFGLFTKWNVKDKLVPIVAILSVLISLLLNAYGEVWFNYTFGFEILMVNGLLTFLGLILIRRK